MTSNSDDIQAVGSDTRPPMLDRTDYESWSQRIRLYCRGKENGLQILQSIDQGPFELGTTRNTLGTTPEGGVLLGPERPRTYDDLSDTEKKRYDADVRATNIVLQGLPKDIYKLINHNIEAKAIWDNVKMLLAGSELTKEDRESQLYDEFERFKMLPDRLIIERITPTTNDQLAFVSTVQPYAQSSHVQSHQYPSSSAAPQSLQHPQFPETSQIDSGHSQTDEILDNLTKQMALLAQSFRATLPQTNNQLRTSSNTRNQATVQDGRIVVQNVQGRQNQNQNQRYFARGNGAAGNGGAQHRAGNANAGQGKPIKCYNCNGLGHIARNCTQPKRPQNSDYFKDKMLLMQAQENGAVLDEEELLFLAGEQANTFDADVDNQPVQDLALNEDNIFQADECDAFDSDVDDEPTAQSIFMANLSSAGPANLQAGPSNASILSEVVQIVLWYLDSGCSKHMTGDRSRLRNFVKKFIGTVRFGNDHFGAIMGYGDYVIGDSVISRVYYVEGLGHNLFSVGQFCDSDLEVAFRKHTCFVRDLDGVDLIKGSRGTNLYTISVEDMMSSLCPHDQYGTEILFQLCIVYEYFKTSTVDRLVPPAPAAQAPVNPTGPSVSIPIDQEASSGTCYRCLVVLLQFCTVESQTENFKSAVTKDCWFEAMQDEIHEFDRLQVWELVPPPDCAMIIALKWIYKVKLNEYGDVFKNKARLVAKEYHQEEGLILRNPSPWLPDLKL
ncbi:retrovirus-related pol polyprotein from transposon TNT 1-94 [Tanacetum coccineum]|uniref:Retrovirus-related pol polyprotein from transposon TNT 1-94 n=1 Tax=Tanacetum coccineum TaxID=301880 RepID=A0ABQ4Z4Y5_9ASTR